MVLSKECEFCKKTFYNHPCQTSGSRTWINKKYCSINCCNQVKKNGHHIKCKTCEKSMYVSKCDVKYNKKFCSIRCKGIYQKESFKGINNHQWKGNNVGYHGLHEWVRKVKGKPLFCKFSNQHKAKRYEWANKSGKYLRKANDWVSLCPSCHRYFDKGTHKSLIFTDFGRPMIVRQQ